MNDRSLEKEVEQALVQMVHKHGGLCLKWVCPGWSGVPDRIILLPGGRCMFVELKRPKGGKIHPRQQWWASRLRALGFWSCFVFDADGLQTLELIIMGERVGL